MVDGIVGGNTPLRQGWSLAGASGDGLMVVMLMMVGGLLFANAVAWQERVGAGSDADGIVGIDGGLNAVLRRRVAIVNVARGGEIPLDPRCVDQMAVTMA